jgi:hypothetical protein
LFILQRRKFGRIVRAEQFDVADRQAREPTQTGQIRPSRRAVDADERLEDAQTRGRRTAAWLDLGMVEICVAAMEQPIIRPPDGHAAMATRMAR